MGENEIMTAEQKPPGAGDGTFNVIDGDRFFEELPVEPSTVFLDLGCGKGDYTLAIAETIGPGGTVYAIDAWQGGLARTRAQGGRPVDIEHPDPFCKCEQDHSPRKSHRRHLPDGDRLSRSLAGRHR
jgi:SAM-dependent methyltransferase